MASRMRRAMREALEKSASERSSRLRGGVSNVEAPLRPRSSRYKTVVRSDDVALGWLVTRVHEAVEERPFATYLQFLLNVRSDTVCGAVDP